MTRNHVALLVAALAVAPTWAQDKPAPPQPKKPDAKKKKEDTPKKFERPIATIELSSGTIRIELEPADAPIAVANFIALAQRGFYNGLVFHRVEDWVIQGGDPQGNGSGGPGYTIPNDFNRALKHQRGAVGMANAGKDTAGSQFYILKKDAPSLDGGNYTLFARVISGQDIADKVAIGDRITKLTIALPEKYKPKPFGPTRRAEPENLAFPNLPEDAATRDFSRRVRVRAEVSVQGIANISLTRGSGDDEVDAAIIAALNLWKWQPALKDGQPIAEVQEFEYDLTTRSRHYGEKK